MAIGAKLWMVRPLGFRTDNYYLRRAGLDYWQFLEWQVVDEWNELREHLQDCRFWYFSKTASRCYAEIDFQKTDALVFGGESQGLPKNMLTEANNAALQIPIREQVRSLNVSNAVAVVAYEALRQWSFA